MFPGRLKTGLFLLLLPPAMGMGQQPARRDDEVGSKACVNCHPEIARKYFATSMSRSSGKVGEGPMLETFDGRHFLDRLGADYRVSISAEGYRLEFSRQATGARGERMLRWYVGSGRVGRSYVFSLDGFLFQAPVSYYTTRSVWEISPGFEQHQSMHFTRAVTTKCLQCHASRLQPIAGTENRFGSSPFLEGGISCERCHGPGKSHVEKILAGDGAGVKDIVNPARLDAARRDSICAQCHLTGAARVPRSDALHTVYRPGELLSDYVAYFVWTGLGSPAGSQTASANSHFERLARSVCKRASGDRLWCGTCHDAHYKPGPVERLDFYRTRCRKCHEGPALPECTESLAARRKLQDDCIDCHMPKGQVRETEHAVFTDHSIPRRQIHRAEASVTGGTLVPFWSTPVEKRDLGLAYAMVASDDSTLSQRARELLQESVAVNPDDLPVLVQLVQLYDAEGREEQAMALSERIMRLDPAQTAVAVNLGTFYMKRGRAQDAMRLWQDALARNPGLTGARINLAVAQYRAGDSSTAEATLRKAIEYDPDQQTARKLLAEIQGERR